MHRLKKTVYFMFILLLVGCKAQLYTGLNERDGNDMLALLLNSGVPATKELNKDKQITLFVPESDVARSIQLLRSNGYPRDNFSSVGDIFPKDGLISSPTEERARYTYSMSQELSSTLSMIDGVVTARVHVVLPQEANGILENPYPSSAAVFIKYNPELVLAGFIPKVKTLVSNSIEGLSLDKITVTLFPSELVTTQDSSGFKQKDSISILGIEIDAESKKRFFVLIGFILFLAIFSTVVAGIFAWLLFKKGSDSEEPETLDEDIEDDFDITNESKK